MPQQLVATAIRHSALQGAHLRATPFHVSASATLIGSGTHVTVSPSLGMQSSNSSMAQMRLLTLRATCCVSTYEHMFRASWHESPGELSGDDATADRVEEGVVSREPEQQSRAPLMALQP